MLKKEGKSTAWYIMMSLIMFGFIYEFYLYAFGIPSFITSSRISAIIITIVALIKSSKKSVRDKRYLGEPRKAIRRFCWFHVPIFLYMLFLYIAIGVQGDSRHMVTILFHTFVFRILPIWAFFICIDKLDELMKILLIATGIQTAIVWLCITNPVIMNMIDTTFHLGEMYTYRDTYAGGLGCITSQGLIRYAVGEVACVYYYYKKNNIWYIALLLLFSLTGSMIARTGLLVAIICILFVLYYVIRRKKLSVFGPIVVSAVLALFVTSMVLESSSNRSFFSFRFTYMLGLFEETETATDIYDITFFDKYMHDINTYIPPITYKTLIGTGVPSGTSGNGVYVNVDGGFFRLYVAYGLILAVVFYVFFLVTTLRVSYSFYQKEIRYTMLLMLSLIIVGEIKEWNIYASCHVTIFFLIALLAHKEYIQKIVVKNDNNYIVKKHNGYYKI